MEQIRPKLPYSYYYLHGCSLTVCCIFAKNVALNVNFRVVCATLTQQGSKSAILNLLGHRL